MGKTAGLATRRFAHLLRIQRDRQGLSQRALATLLKISQANVGKIENLRLREGTVRLDLVERAISLWHLDANYFFIPGPDALDPLQFLQDRRSPLERRLALVENKLRELGDTEPPPDSSTHPIRRRRR